jgi:hypothetical protein
MPAALAEAIEGGAHFLTPCLYEWITIAAGRMALAGPAFGELARSVRGRTNIAPRTHPTDFCNTICHFRTNALVGLIVTKTAASRQT